MLNLKIQILIPYATSTLFLSNFKFSYWIRVWQLPHKLIISTAAFPYLLSKGYW